MRFFGSLHFAGAWTARRTDQADTPHRAIISRRHGRRSRVRCWRSSQYARSAYCASSGHGLGRLAAMTGHSVAGMAYQAGRGVFVLLSICAPDVVSIGRARDLGGLLSAGVSLLPHPSTMGAGGVQCARHAPDLTIQ